MSAGYAARLKDYPDKGVCGLPELKDTQRALNQKYVKLEKLVRESWGRIVILTGAGISTAAGIPDFRGPQGIWTLEQEEENRNRQEQQQKNSNNNDNGRDSYKEQRQKREPVHIDFAKARPTYTHQCIKKLVDEGVVKFVITQNVDGLHRRSGLSRNKHAVLHGCAFTEKCEDCMTEHFRDYDVGGMSFQPTGRTCSVCDGVLRDVLLDWEDELPADDLERSEDACQHADLVLALGTSLRIEPAGSLPLQAKRYVICNLQRTPKDKSAALIIRTEVDTIMKELMHRLGFDDRDFISSSSDATAAAKTTTNHGNNNNNVYPNTPPSPYNKSSSSVNIERIWNPPITTCIEEISHSRRPPKRTRRQQS